MKYLAGLFFGFSLGLIFVNLILSEHSRPYRKGFEAGVQQVSDSLYKKGYQDGKKHMLDSVVTDTDKAYSNYKSKLTFPDNISYQALLEERFRK